MGVFRFAAMAAAVFTAACASQNDGLDVTRFDPLNVERTGKPNDYLVCPNGQCASDADTIAPTIAGDMVSVRERFISALEREERLTITARSEKLINAEQSSALFGFVDDLSIRLIEDAGGTSFAIYSRSRVGYYDMGVNKSRVQRIIERVMNDKS